MNEWQENHRRFRGEGPKDLTVNELMLTFWSHVEAHYRHPDGTPTSEVENYRYSLRPVRELYGYTPVADFGPLALKAVRRKMIDVGLARGVINQRIGRIRAMFKWAVAEELVDPSAYHALQAVLEAEKGHEAAGHQFRRIQPPASLLESSSRRGCGRRLASAECRKDIQGLRLDGPATDRTATLE